MVFSGCSNDTDRSPEEIIEATVAKELQISATVEATWRQRNHGIDKLVKSKLAAIPQTTPIPDKTLTLLDIDPHVTPLPTQIGSDDLLPEKPHIKYKNPYPTETHPWPKLGGTNQNRNLTPYHIQDSAELLWHVRTTSEVSSPIISKTGIIYVIETDDHLLYQRNSHVEIVVKDAILMGFDYAGRPKIYTQISYTDNINNSLTLDHHGNTIISILNGLACPRNNRGWIYILDNSGERQAHLACSDSVDYMGLFSVNPEGIYAGPSHISNTSAINWGNPVVGVSTAIDLKGNIVLVDNEQNLLYSLNSDGDLIWKTNIPKESSYPVIGKEGRIFISGNSRIIAYTEAGKLDWKSPYVQSDVISDPSLNPDGSILVSSDYGILYKFRPDGSSVTSKQIGKYPGTPVIDPSGNILITFNRSLNLISPSGYIIWSHYIGLHRSNPAVGADGTVYTNCLIGKQENPGLCAFGESKAKDAWRSEMYDAGSKGVWYFAYPKDLNHNIMTPIIFAINEAALNPEFFFSETQTTPDTGWMEPEMRQIYKINEALESWDGTFYDGLGARTNARVCVSNANSDKPKDHGNALTAIRYIRNALTLFGVTHSEWQVTHCDIHILVDIEPEMIDIETSTPTTSTPEPTSR